MRKLILFPLLALVVACGDSPILEPELAVSPEMGMVSESPGEVMVAVPWKADFSVWNHSDYSDMRCGGYPNFFLTMRGHGNITHLGAMTVEFTFCANVATGYYWDSDGVYVAANGDELYIDVPEGQIYPNTGDDSDYYQTWFDDTAFFTGGTGRFEGASGTYTTNAWVHSGADEWRTDFFSTGTLVLKKGTN